MYKEELENPNRPASKFKADALVLHGKLERARQVTANSQTPKEVSEPQLQPPPAALTSQPVPVVQAVNGDVHPSDNEVRFELERKDTVN